VIARAATATTAVRGARARRAAEHRRRVEIAAGLGRIARREIVAAGRVRADPGPEGIVGAETDLRVGEGSRSDAMSPARRARPRRRS